MKTTITFLLFLAVMTTSALAIDKSELDARIRKVATLFDELQSKPDKKIPADVLKKAQGIILLDRTKAGFIFAFSGGSGVGMARHPKTQDWSPVGFYKANEASLGLQIGGQKSFLVILMMDTNATQILTGSRVDWGGEASGTAGDQSGKAEGIANALPSVMVYDDRTGLYGGAAVKGGSIEPDSEANVVYYGQAVTPAQIVFENKVKATDPAKELEKKINEQAKPAKK
jgi:SH3 domain-containing YSC84-like protein 1